MCEERGRERECTLGESTRVQYVYVSTMWRYVRSVAVGINGGQWYGSNLGFSHRTARFVMRNLAAVTEPARRQLNHPQSACSISLSSRFSSSPPRLFPSIS